MGGGLRPHDPPLQISGRAERVLKYWREAARFARHLTPVIETVARFARSRRTKEFLDFAFWKLSTFQTELGLIGLFRACSTHRWIRFEKSYNEIVTRGLETNVKVS